MAVSNHSSCVDLPIYKNNKTFCGVTELWKPRISNNIAIILCAVPSIVAWLLTLFIIYHIKKYLFSIYNDSFEQDTFTSAVKLEDGTQDNLQEETIIKPVKDQNSYQKKHWCCIYIYKIYLVFTIIILTILKLLWDALDVTIDTYLFFHLETGKVIHEHVYRNTHVNNAILAFAVLGCFKILFWIRIVGGLRGSKKRKYLNHLKEYFVAGTFIFEDGPELILEYFFVEKYMSKQLTWYWFARDIILCLISLYTIVISFLFLRSGISMQRKNRHNKLKTKCSRLFEYTVTNGCNVVIGLLLFLRAGGAGYQYVTGKLGRSCFAVEDGFLIQTPFTVGCLREVDYVIIVLSGISILLSFLSLFFVNHILSFLQNPFSNIGAYSFWEFRYYKFC